MTIDLPKLVTLQFLQPFRLYLRKRLDHPKTQEQMASMVEASLSHKIRAGFTHRLIPILFVKVEDRIFVRRYQYNEPSWYNVFLSDPAGQIKLDKTIVNIECRVPDDMNTILPKVDKAYADKLKKLGARFMLDGAITPLAQNSTMELTLTGILDRKNQTR